MSFLINVTTEAEPVFLTVLASNYPLELESKEYH